MYNFFFLVCSFVCLLKPSFGVCLKLARTLGDVFHFQSWVPSLPCSGRSQMLVCDLRVCVSGTPTRVKSSCATCAGHPFVWRAGPGRNHAGDGCERHEARCNWWLCAPSSQHYSPLQARGESMADVALGSYPMFPICDHSCVWSFVLSNN